MDITSLASLPTDSLYKFMALSGLLLTVFASAAPFYYRTKLVLQLFEVEKRYKILSFRHGKIDNKLKDVKHTAVAKNESLHQLHNDKQTELQQRAQGAKPTDKLPFDVMRNREEVEKLDAAITSLEQDVYEHKIASIELESEVGTTKYLTDQLRLLYAIQVLGLIAGISLSAGGFYNWYMKHQRYVDSALELQCAPTPKQVRPNPALNTDLRVAARPRPVSANVDAVELTPESIINTWRPMA